MKNAKNFFLLPFIFLLLALLVLPVSADITVHFVDRSYLGNNPVTITGFDGSELFNGTTSSIATIPADNFTASYWVSFEPGGTVDLIKSPQKGAEEILHVIQGGIAGIAIILIILWAWRRR